MLRQVAAVVAKDIRTEVRSREVVLSALLFAALVVVIFAFALKGVGGKAAPAAPGVIWVAVAFAGTLAMARSVVRDQESGGLEGVLASPAPAPTLFLGKLAGNLLFVGLTTAVVVPMAGMLLGVSAFPRPGLLLAGLLLGCFGFAVVGTLFSAVLLSARFREVLLPLALYPVTVPVLIGGVEVTAFALGQPRFGEPGGWLRLMVAYDVLFLVVALWAFGWVLRE